MHPGIFKLYLVKSECTKEGFISDLSKNPATRELGRKKKCVLDSIIVTEDVRAVKLHLLIPVPITLVPPWTIPGEWQQLNFPQFLWLKQALQLQAQQNGQILLNDRLLLLPHSHVFCPAVCVKKQPHHQSAYIPAVCSWYDPHRQVLVLISDTCFSYSLWHKGCTSWLGLCCCEVLSLEDHHPSLLASSL